MQFFSILPLFCPAAGQSQHILSPDLCMPRIQINFHFRGSLLFRQVLVRKFLILRTWGANTRSADTGLRIE